MGASKGIAYHRFVSFNDQIKKLLAASPPLSTYFNLTKYADFGAKAETPFTPALPIFYALDEALKMVMEEGMDRRIARHRVPSSRRTTPKRLQTALAKAWIASVATWTGW